MSRLDDLLSRNSPSGTKKKYSFYLPVEQMNHFRAFWDERKVEYSEALSAVIDDFFERHTAGVQDAPPEQISEEARDDALRGLTYRGTSKRPVPTVKSGEISYPKEKPWQKKTSPKR